MKNMEEVKLGERYSLLEGLILSTTEGNMEIIHDLIRKETVAYLSIFRRAFPSLQRPDRRAVHR